MKKICFLTTLLCLCLTTLNAQTVQPSIINLRALEAIDKQLPAPTIKKIGNQETVEEDRLPLKFPFPPGAIKKPQPENLKSTPNGPNSISTASPLPINTFPSIADNATSIPPDIHGCVGPNHLVTALNTELKITDKTGAQLVKISTSSFWAGVTPGGLSDPHINYDHYTNRWIMIGQSNLDATSSILVAVSQTNDPTGNWNRYAFRVDLTSVNGFDYPLVGYNQNWLVVSGNLFKVTGGTFNGSQLYIFNMADLNAGNAVTIGTNAQRINNPTGSGSVLSPVTTYETGAPSNPLYIVQNWNGGSKALRLTTLTGTIPTVTFNEGAATFPIGSTAWASGSGVANGNSSPQAVEARKINSGDARMCNAVMVNGKIWTTHHVFFPSAGPTNAAIQWWQLQTDGTVLQNGFVDDGTAAVHRTYPSIAVNSNEDVLIGYSKFTTTTYPSCAYVFRNASTPINTMQDEYVFKNGIDKYWKDFGAGRCRWGDYSATSIDPVSGRLWTIQEFSDTRANTGATDNDSRWSSQWAEVGPVNAANEIYFKNSGIIISETGNTGTCPRYKDYSIPVGISGTATGNATVNFSGAGAATNGQDYQILTPTLSYIIGDNTTKNITLRVFDDVAIESTETFNLSYTITGTGVVAASTGQVTSISIVDDDKIPVAVNVTQAVVGTGGTQLQASSPFRASLGTQSRYQSIYTAAELSAAGFAAGTFTKFAYNYVTANTTYTNITIKIASTNATGFTAGDAFLNPAFTTLVSGSITSPALAGYSDLPGAATFVWDGISNVLIDVCYDSPTSTADILVYGTQPGGNPTVYIHNSGAVSGCSITNSTNASSFHPDIRFSENTQGPTPETALNSTVTVPFAPGDLIYVYNGAGKIMASAKNTGTVDYGCTTFTIDRQGTGAVQFWNNNAANFLMSKSFKVVPTNNSATGSYEINLYYTAAEVNGWQTATGQSINSAQMVKVSNGHYIPDVTPATNYFSDVTIVSSLVTPYGPDYILKGVFTNTTFSGFGVGIPASPLPVTSLNFSGYEKNNLSQLNWTTTSEYNNKGFELEKSFDGINFSKIAFVAGAGTTNTNRNYVYTDAVKLTTVQYYRLKQIDIDGRFVYSSVVAIRKNSSSDLKVLSVTNPFKNDVKMIFTEPLQNKTTFELYDVSGKLVYTTQQTVYGNTAIIKVPDNISKGIYILKIMTQDFVFNEQLLKN